MNPVQHTWHPCDFGFLPTQAELEKRKNDEETEEGWVQCDVCECWVHQICGLFNKGRNKEETPYVCPMCLLDGARPDLASPHVCILNPATLACTDDMVPRSAV